MKNNNCRVFFLALSINLLLASTSNAALILPDPTINLVEGGTEFFTVSTTVPLNNDYLFFEFIESNPGDGDWANLYFDSTLLWSTNTALRIPPIVGKDTAKGHDDWIDVSSIAGQSGTFSFSLTSVGDVNANYVFQNIAFVDSAPTNVPEPASLALIGLGLVGMGFARRKKAA